MKTTLCLVALIAASVIAGERHHEDHHEEHHHRFPKIIFPEASTTATTAQTDLSEIFDLEMQSIEDSYAAAYGNISGGCVSPSEITQVYQNASQVSSNNFVTDNLGDILSSIKKLVKENLRKTERLYREFVEDIEHGPKSKCNKKYLHRNDDLYENYIKEIQKCVNSLGGSSTAVAKQKVIVSIKYISYRIVESITKIGYEACSGLGSGCSGDAATALCDCQKAVSFFSFKQLKNE